MSKKIALITGATSGIGAATAQLFAQNHINLVLCGRRADRLAELKQQFSQWVEVQTLCFDLLDPQQILTAAAELKGLYKQIDILINNAGNAHGMDSFEDGDLEDWDTMLDLNVRGLLHITKHVLPLLFKSSAPQIINVGSIAGYAVYPKGNIYCASKYAVRAITDALRVDLYKRKVKVSSINPGLVETEFSLVRFKGDEEQARRVYAGLEPLKSIDVAKVILYMVQAPPHVNLAEVTLLSIDQADAIHVNRH